MSNNYYNLLASQNIIYCEFVCRPIGAATKPVVHSRLCATISVSNHLVYRLFVFMLMFMFFVHPPCNSVTKQQWPATAAACALSFSVIDLVAVVVARAALCGKCTVASAVAARELTRSSQRSARWVRDSLLFQFQISSSAHI